MKRIIVLLAAGLCLVAVAWSQDDTAEDSEAAESAATVDQAGQPDETESDDTDLDEQGYEDVDDDFRPSEEISTDQSIAFPTDI